jgi:sarcosine oxidase subunit gamma
MCTRTLFGKAEVLLWRRAAEEYHLEVGRSFAEYIRGCLRSAQ